jgi:hypothetical protein
MIAIEEDRFRSLVAETSLLMTRAGRVFRLNLADFIVATGWRPAEELEIEATDKYRSTFIIRRFVSDLPEEIVGVEL